MFAFSRACGVWLPLTRSGRPYTQAGPSEQGLNTQLGLIELPLKGAWAHPLEAVVASIHRAAEKGYFWKPDEQQGIKKAGIVLSRLLDIR